MDKRRLFAIVLIMVSAITYGAVCISNADRAESPGVLLLLTAMMLPVLPVIIITEIIQLCRANDKAELAGLVLALIGAFLMSAFWFFMVLVGEDKNKTMAIAVIGINCIAVLLLWIKIRISRL